MLICANFWVLYKIALFFCVLLNLILSDFFLATGTFFPPLFSLGFVRKRTLCCILSKKIYSGCSCILFVMHLQTKDCFAVFLSSDVLRVSLVSYSCNFQDNRRSIFLFPFPVSNLAKCSILLLNVFCSIDFCHLQWRGFFSNVCLLLVESYVSGFRPSFLGDIFQVICYFSVVIIFSS